MTETIDPPYIVEEYKRTRHGFRERVKGTAPAAATDYAVTMEGRYVTRLQSLSVLLTTDATAGDRELVLEYRTGEALRFALFGAPVEVTASDTVSYLFQTGMPAAAWPVDDSVLVPIVDYPLLPSESFRQHIVGVQAADTLTLIRYTWERFYTDDLR